MISQIAQTLHTKTWQGAKWLWHFWVLTCLQLQQLQLTLFCLWCSQPPASLQSPDLFSSESYEWEAIQNLDQFFTRVYRYVTIVGVPQKDCILHVSNSMNLHILQLQVL